jgi:hypothetical protein
MNYPLQIRLEDYSNMHIAASTEQEVRKGRNTKINLRFVSYVKGKAMPGQVF